MFNVNVVLGSDGFHDDTGLERMKGLLKIVFKVLPWRKMTTIERHEAH